MKSQWIISAPKRVLFSCLNITLGGRSNSRCQIRIGMKLDKNGKRQR